MIEAEFKFYGGLIKSFMVKGHAGFDVIGRDIVCAGVSSATLMVLNAFDEVLKEKKAIKVEDNLISLVLKKPNENTEILMRAYYNQIKLLSSEYNENIKVIEEAI